MVDAITAFFSGKVFQMVEIEICLGIPGWRRRLQPIVIEASEGTRPDLGHPSDVGDEQHAPRVQ